MSVQELYDAALDVLRSHNEAVGGKDQPGYVEEEKFLRCLKLSGATTPEALKALTYEEILSCLPEYEGIKPFALARAIATKFRSLSPAQLTDNIRRPVSAIRADRMTPEELVQSFDPEDISSPVAERLKKLSRNLAFVVYKTGREVDVERTIILLKEIKGGYDARKTFEGKRVYRIGELPDNYAEENPLYPGRPLRPDGSCDQLNRSWQGVPKIVRQFVRFALDYKNGIDVTSPGGRDRAHNVLDMALAADALEKFRTRYPEIAVEFDEAERRNELPNLLIPLGQPVTPGKKGGPGDPFAMAVR